MQLKASDLLDDILLKYSKIPLPKNKFEYECQLGGIMGLAIVQLPFAKREQSIAILSKKYRYHSGCLFKSKAKMRLHYSQFICDLMRCEYLSVYNNLSQFASNQEKDMSNFFGIEKLKQWLFAHKLTGKKILRA